MESIDVFAPLASLQWVDRNTIHANDYNPNKVSEENLKLLIQSILTNGWTLPIVVRPDGTVTAGSSLSVTVSRTFRTDWAPPAKPSLNIFVDERLGCQLSVFPGKADSDDTPRKVGRMAAVSAPLS